MSSSKRSASALIPAADLNRVRKELTDTEQRLLEAVGGKQVDIVVDWESFESCPDISAAINVLIEHAFDRLAATVEWFCEWDSSRQSLYDAIVSIHIKHSQESQPPRVEQGRVLFADHFADADGFPQDNIIAQVLDEGFRLYEGRITDIHNKIIPPYEARIRSAIGSDSFQLRIDLDNFSTLDWEGDDYYNAYTELTPSYSDEFFGRIVEAITSLAAQGRKAQLSSALSSVLVRLSIDDSKSIKLEGSQLVLSERFWNGPEHTQEEIQSYLTSALPAAPAPQARTAVPTQQQQQQQQQQRTSLGGQGVTTQSLQHFRHNTGVNLLYVGAPAPVHLERFNRPAAQQVPQAIKPTPAPTPAAVTAPAPSASYKRLSTSGAPIRTVQANPTPTSKRVSTSGAPGHRVISSGYPQAAPSAYNPRLSTGSAPQGYMPAPGRLSGYGAGPASFGAPMGFGAPYGAPGGFRPY